MTRKLIDRTPSAYKSPLLIKHILDTALTSSGCNQIVYSDVKRHDYKTLYRRIGQLANVLKRLGIKAGDTVGIMDWHSHRYLESLFSVPMMGATLHTLNVRRPCEQVLYTINHAEDDVLLVHSDFLRLMEKIRSGMKTVKNIIVLTDRRLAPRTHLNEAGEYESLVEESRSEFDFPDFSEKSKATTFYATNTTGVPRAISLSHRQVVLHTQAVISSFAQSARVGISGKDVYMPLIPISHTQTWGLPYVASMLGMKQVYPGRYTPETLLGLIAKEGVTLSNCLPAVLQMLLGCPASAAVDLSGLRILTGGSSSPGQLHWAARQRGIHIYAGHGLSETHSAPTDACMAGLSEKEHRLSLRGLTALAFVRLYNQGKVHANLRPRRQQRESTRLAHAGLKKFTLHHRVEAGFIPGLTPARSFE